MVRIRFSVWLVSCYAHVFVRLKVVIVTDRLECGTPCTPPLVAVEGHKSHSATVHGRGERCMHRAWQRTVGGTRPTPWRQTQQQDQLRRNKIWTMTSRYLYTNMTGI